MTNKNEDDSLLKSVYAIEWWEIDLVNKVERLDHYSLHKNILRANAFVALNSNKATHALYYFEQRNIRLVELNSYLLYRRIQQNGDEVIDVLEKDFE